jgi:hypothetical protein
MRPALVPFFKKRISTNPGRVSKNYKKYMGSSVSSPTVHTN